MRALGGPVFNLVGLLLSAMVFALAANHPIAKELVAWSALGHGLLLIMSLSPLPVVDGGTLLKWTLVAGGRTETEADAIVRRVAWVIGVMGGLIGLGLVAMRVWVIGLILLGVGVVVIDVAAGRIR